MSCMSLGGAERPKKCGRGAARLMIEFAFILAVCLMTVSSAGRALASSGYTLGPMDVVRIRAHEWRQSQDQVLEWAALKEDFRVNAEGALSLPLIGELPAAGLTTGELADLIGKRLKDRLQLIAAPDTAVEIIKYRPFFILGEVDRPGEYPYRPGLTVLQSIALAGGLLRVRDLGGVRLEREAISTEGDLKMIQSELDSLVARRARFEAELDEAPDVSFPQQLVDKSSDPVIRVILDQELLIFRTRQRSFKAQFDALQQLKSYLKTELQSLAGQIETQNTQLKLVKGELDDLRGLSKKGLVTAPRLLQNQRLLAQLESDKLRLESSQAKAQQEISKTEISILEVRNKFVNEVTGELRQTQAKIEELQSKSETGARLLYESRVVAPRLIGSRSSTQQRPPMLKIIRQVSGFANEIIASEATPVEPGDTVKVEFVDDGAAVVPLSMNELMDRMSKPRTESPVRQDRRAAPPRSRDLGKAGARASREPETGEGLLTLVAATGEESVYVAPRNTTSLFRAVTERPARSAAVGKARNSEVRKPCVSKRCQQRVAASRKKGQANAGSARRSKMRYAEQRHVKRPSPRRIHVSYFEPGYTRVRYNR